MTLASCSEEPKNSHSSHHKNDDDDNDNCTSANTIKENLCSSKSHENRCTYSKCGLREIDYDYDENSDIIDFVIEGNPHFCNDSVIGEDEDKMRRYRSGRSFSSILTGDSLFGLEDIAENDDAETGPGLVHDPVQTEQFDNEVGNPDDGSEDEYTYETDDDETSQVSEVAAEQPRVAAETPRTENANPSDSEDEYTYETDDDEELDKDPTGPQKVEEQQAIEEESDVEYIYITDDEEESLSEKPVKSEKLEDRSPPAAENVNGTVDGTEDSEHEDSEDEYTYVTDDESDIEPEVETKVIINNAHVINTHNKPVVQDQNVCATIKIEKVQTVEVEEYEEQTDDEADEIDEVEEAEKVSQVDENEESESESENEKPIEKLDDSNAVFTVDVRQKHVYVIQEPSEGDESEESSDDERDEIIEDQGNWKVKLVTSDDKTKIPTQESANNESDTEEIEEGTEDEYEYVTDESEREEESERQEESEREEESKKEEESEKDEDQIVENNVEKNKYEIDLWPERKSKLQRQLSLTNIDDSEPNEEDEEDDELVLHARVSFKIPKTLSTESDDRPEESELLFDEKSFLPRARLTPIFTPPFIVHPPTFTNNEYKPWGNNENTIPEVTESQDEETTGDELPPMQAPSKFNLTIESPKIPENNDDYLALKLNQSISTESDFDEEDSGVTTDLSRLAVEETDDTESESFPELRKMSRYERAATHSRLFKLLQENEPDNKFSPISEKSKKIVHNVSITRRTNPEALKSAETVNERRERLSWHLKDSIDNDNPSSSSSPTPVNDKLIEELVQSALIQAKKRNIEHVPIEKIQEAARKALMQQNSEDNTSFSSFDSTPALTPQEFYDSDAEKINIPSKAFQNLKEQSIYGRKRKLWAARCPRVLSSKAVNSDLSRVAEIRESQSPESNYYSRNSFN